MIHGQVFDEAYWAQGGYTLKKGSPKHALLNSGFVGKLRTPGKTPKAEKKFLQRAISAFKGSGWVPVLQKRLKEIE